MMEVFVSKSAFETQKIAERFAQKFKKRIIALYGELGSGKTTFVQGLAKGLGIKRRIISPTFTIIRRYKLKAQILRQKRGSMRAAKLKFTGPTLTEASANKQNQKLENFYHIDLYRIENGKDIKWLGIKEILDEPKNIVVVEWGEKIRKFLPKKRIDIFFEYINEKERKIVINNF